MKQSRIPAPVPQVPAPPMSVSRLLLASTLALAATGAFADATYHPLADGSFSQNWTNVGLITADDNWSGVPSVEGHLGDGLTGLTGADPRTIIAFGTGTLDVIANNTDPSAATSGGVYEVEGGAPIGGNPTVGFQGSGTADAPFLLLRLNTTGCSNINISYNLRDIDTAETTAGQQVVLQARTGQSGDFANVTGTYVAVANNGGTTPGAATLDVGLENQPQVQLRWLTTNAANVDAMIGIDDIQVTGTCADIAPTVASTSPVNLATNVNPTSNVSVNFSEPVTTNAGWFAMTCTVSGPVSVAESGSGASRTLDPVVNLVFGEQCSATILAASVIDQDGVSLDPMASNYVFGFTVQPDNLPTVVSTTPVNLATNVAAVSNIDVVFSEAVTTNGGWFALNCTVSGAVAVVESGTGATRSLDPSVNLAPGEQCTGSITAANVLDQDGTPNAMAANFSFSFTVQPDNVPTVTTTSPANGVGGVAVNSNLTINFSEPVSVSGSWYAISCAFSGAHTAVVSGAGTSYTLNPDVDFDFLESCTVTLTGALVVDQDGAPDALASNYAWSFTSAASASNYYASVDASTATSLRNTLHLLIDDHIAYRYSISTNNCNRLAPSTADCDVWDIVELAEQDPGDTTKVLDVYRNRKYAKITDRSGNTGPTTYNREHTWPNSHGFNDLTGTDGNGNAYSPYVDTHMLYASASDYNSNRGNKAYDDCLGTRSEDATDLNYGFGGGTGVYPGNSNWDCSTGYQTWNHRKGDVARAVLYMDVRYEGGNHANGQPEPDLIVTNDTGLIAIVTPSGQVASTGYMGMLSTLLAWHAADPPDAQELLRNELIYSFQGNRNPFIDHPEWVGCLWQGSCAAATVPSAPTSVVATAGNTQVSVAFSAPSSNGGSAITSYTATCGAQSAGGSGPPIVVTGLPNGVAVTCTVIATNGIGPSLPSAASNSVTPAPSAPNAPTSVVATAGDSSVLVAFTAPANDGGSPILGYTATCGAQSGGGGVSPITVGGLANGVAVNCTVFATNAIGPGAPSAVSNTVTPAGAPGAPTAVVATAGNGQVSVAFSAPSSNNGSAIISYTAECGGPVFTGPSSPIVVTGLSNGTPVSCTVFATNGVSNGPASTPSNTVTPATVPNAPTSVVATAGSSQVTVSFAVPGNNGGSAITGYTATCGAQSMSGAASPIVVVGLSNGVAVTCTVIASNGIGNSAPSAASNSVTPTDLLFANGFD